MPRRALLVAVVPLFAAACTGTRSPSSGACFPVSAMRLEIREHDDEWEPVAWLDADGTFHRKDSREPAGAAVRVVGDAVVDANGRPGMRCGADHVLRQDGSPFTMRFGADDALADAMDRIYVRDDGLVEGSFSHAHKSEIAPWRVTAKLPEERRTAELLVLLAMMSTDWSFD